MSGFHDIRFPMRLALGAIGGPERRSQIITLASGRETRNSTWSQSRRRWDVGGAITDLARLQELVAFFEARAGRLFGFRFRDPLDFSSAAPGNTISETDQVLGRGDGATQSFYLQKVYGEVARPITKPVASSVVVAANGNPLASGWSLEASTGELSFESPPAAGVTVSAGFEFDCAVRFESDQIQAVIEAFGTGRIASVGLVEIH